MHEGPKISVLLIDDDEDDRSFFCMAAEDSVYNIECYTSKSAKEALAVLKRKEISPDFIFLDLNMPEIDGRTCLRELKNNDTTKAIPVIIFSTSSEQQDIKETKNLGAVDFLTKASSIGELTNDIDNFLKQQSK